MKKIIMSRCLPKSILNMSGTDVPEHLENPSRIFSVQKSRANHTLWCVVKRKDFLILTVMISIILLASLAFAHENFTEAKKLVEEKVSCDNLTNEQIEEIGDYLMEIMHPGDVHIQMHNTMGGENSERVKLMHTNMAKTMYCNNGEGMNNMTNMMSSGMMGSGMMGMMNMMGGNVKDSGMMGNYPTYYSYGYNGFWNIIRLIFLIGVIVLVIFIIYKLTRKGKESETPIDILQGRYVKGEINKKKFEEMKKEIGE